MDYFCFECGSRNNIHHHHVIPRSLGGKNTVPLCEHCHSLVHNLNFQDHGTLIKLGIQKAIKDGKKMGRPTGKGSSTDLLVKHPDIVDALKQGLSVRETAKKCGKGNSTVQRIKKLI